MRSFVVEILDKSNRCLRLISLENGEQHSRQHDENRNSRVWWVGEDVCTTYQRDGTSFHHFNQTGKLSIDSLIHDKKGQTLTYFLGSTRTRGLVSKPSIPCRLREPR
jgi:hypothetical protein